MLLSTKLLSTPLLHCLPFIVTKFGHYSGHLDNFSIFETRTLHLVELLLWYSATLPGFEVGLTREESWCCSGRFRIRSVALGFRKYRSKAPKFGWSSKCWDRGKLKSFNEQRVKSASQHKGSPHASRAWGHEFESRWVLGFFKIFFLFLLSFIGRVPLLGLSRRCISSCDKKPPKIKYLDVLLWGLNRLKK